MSSILDLMLPVQTNIARLVPRFLYADKNGHAICKAIEKAMQIMAKAAQEGLEILLDVDKMPEWRLDELAHDYNCLYDYTADVEAKRIWIKNASRMNQILGTPEGVIQYLQGYFDDVEMLESWEYDGLPFHFRVLANGTWSQKKQDWALKAVLGSKNVRSVLDNITIHLPELKGREMKYVGIAIYGACTHTFGPIAMPNLEAENYLVDEQGNYIMDENSVVITD